MNIKNIVNKMVNDTSCASTLEVISMSIATRGSHYLAPKVGKVIYVNDMLPEVDRGRYLSSNNT